MADSSSAPDAELSTAQRNAAERNAADFNAIIRWCALTELGSRKLRSRADSAAALAQLWRAAGSPGLPDHQLDALGQWFGAGNRVLLRWQNDFPATLRCIPDPPVALFVRGNLTALERPRVAMVGSRAATHSGAALARRLACDLSSAGILVVSGLAQGIDFAAHAGALAVQQPTLAIPGSGLGQIYPRGHRGLAEQIVAAGGLLMSEYAPWVAARPASFPARNRLISGLAVGVLVVQAAHRSGSLITARLAAEQGRDVMAVPGVPGSAVGAGCNQLLRDGAALVETAADVFNALGWDSADLLGPPAIVDSAGTEPIDADARLLLQSLDGVPISAEALGQFTGLPGDRLHTALLQLQLVGLVQASPHGYIRAP